jgi:hypothetical protein
MRVLYHEFPEIWKELVEMDKKSFRKFKSNYSVGDLGERFAREDLQLSLFEEELHELQGA